MAHPVAALVLGCLVQGPWNSLPVIDCNTGPRLYGAEVRLKDGRRLRGYVALDQPLPLSRAGLSVKLFKPDCGLTLVEELDVSAKEGPAEDADCIEDDFVALRFGRAWMPREKVVDLAASRLSKAALVPDKWDGVSSERFLILSRAERALLEKPGPDVPVDDYSGSGRLELRGGPGVREGTLWDLAPKVAQAVNDGGRAALEKWKRELLKKKIVLLFYPDVEP